MSRLALNSLVGPEVSGEVGELTGCSAIFAHRVLHTAFLSHPIRQCTRTSPPFSPFSAITRDGCTSPCLWFSGTGHDASHSFCLTCCQFGRTFASWAAVILHPPEYQCCV